jgi:oligopeptide transport system substrate-binding protein
LSQWERARQKHAGEIVSSPLLGTYWVSLFPTGPPLDDVRVRRALVLAADRAKLAVMLGGFGFPATGGFLPPGMPGHTPGIALPYDPELARQLLAEAGYAGGKGFPPLDAFIWTPAHVGFAETLQAMWLENLGIDITWELVDLSTRQREYREGQLEKPHLFICGWAADYPDPDNFLRVGAPETMPACWNSLAYQELIERAGSATSQAERLKLYQKADRMIIEEAVVMPLTCGRQQLLVKPWVARYPVSGFGGVLWKDVIIETH